MLNYSFWADEAYLSGIAAQLVMGKLSILQALNVMNYQRLYILILALFFKLFGMSELVARLPSLIFFVIGIIVIFLLARRLSNVYGGILSTFLYAFSHLNLAYATQAKPYSALETITLLIIFFIVNVQTEKNKRQILAYHIGILSLLCIATFLHTIGVLLWIIYFIFLVSKFKGLKVLNFKRLHILTLLACVLGVVLIVLFVLLFLSGKLFPYNNWYQVVKLFTYKYTLVLVPAAFGYIWLFKKNRLLSSAILLYCSAVLILVTFEHYTFNVRYVLTLFSVLFLYFGIFWAKAGENYIPKKPWIIPLVVLVLLYVTGYKIVRRPQAYYNPNIDKYGDVQIANYKDFYFRLKQRFPQYIQLYVVNDVADAEYWYFGRYSNAYFTKFTPKPFKHPIADVMVYGTLADFKKEITKHPQGLLIMEDWQSLLPDDIKDYAKKNLKPEFRVESLKEAPDDPWPLVLYSWGLK